MKILTISDTHTLHSMIPLDNLKDIDMIIHSGDSSNIYNPYVNEHEVRNFITWFHSLPVKHKIFVAGNHDTSIEKRLITKDNFEACSINYLEHESITIDGINIFGSPYTPIYGNWSFMKHRSKLDEYWKEIPENTDILITHGPPKGIMDLAYSMDNQLEYCGDKSLLNHVIKELDTYQVW